MDNADTILKVWAVVGPLLVAVVSAGWHFYNKNDDRKWARTESIRAVSRERTEAHILEARHLMALAATHAQTAVTWAISEKHEAAINEIAKAMSAANALRLLTNPEIGAAASAMNGAATKACALIVAKHAGDANDDEPSPLKDEYDAFVALCEAYLEHKEEKFVSTTD